MEVVCVCNSYGLGHAILGVINNSENLEITCTFKYAYLQ